MANFNVGGRWQLTQGNGTVVALDLNQVGNELSGSAALTFPPATTGTCVGSMIGGAFFLNIRWADGSFGEYNGIMGNAFEPNRGSRLWGVARAFPNLGQQATWYSDVCFAPLP